LKRFLKIFAGLLLLTQLADSNTDAAVTIFRTLALTSLSEYLLYSKPVDFFLSLPDGDTDEDAFKLVDTPLYYKTSHSDTVCEGNADLISNLSPALNRRILNVLLLDIPPPQVS
jgi:hypothetical protein